MSAKYKFAMWNGRQVRLHQKVYMEAHGINEIPVGFVLHHVDFNRWNNDASNIVMLSKAEHDSLHASMKKREVNGRFVR